MTFLLLLILGLLVGLLSSFFGVGGGVLIVPGLYLFYPTVDHQVVIGTSLFVILCNSIINAINLKKQHCITTIDKKVILNLGIAMVFGALTGSYLTSYFPKQTIKLVFGIVLILISIKHVLSLKAEALINASKPKAKSSFLLRLFGMFGGLISGLTGIGGGAIIVPTLIYLVRIPIKIVSFYSNILMIFSTSTGVIFYIQLLNKRAPVPELQGFQVGALNLALAFFLILGALISSSSGGKLSAQVSPKRSKLLFASLLFIIGIRLIISSFP